MGTQCTDTILMVRPAAFYFNADTAVDNKFQQEADVKDAGAEAIHEFDAMVTALQGRGVNVRIVQDREEDNTPDSIFPNNWFSTHADGRMLLYPMCTENRRRERKPVIINELVAEYGYEITDFSAAENRGEYLEGTGSIILDRENNIAYACLSKRTNAGLFTTVCDDIGYTPVTFTATDENGDAIYHTNVVMSVADRYVVICLDAIADAGEREKVTSTIKNSGKEVVPISMRQLHRFAGNMLQVCTCAGEKLLVMSQTAFESLTAEQRAKLESFNELLHCDLHVIETLGGGSARCMMAEIFYKS